MIKRRLWQIINQDKNETNPEIKIVKNNIIETGIQKPEESKEKSRPENELNKNKVSIGIKKKAIVKKENDKQKYKMLPIFYYVFF